MEKFTYDFVKSSAGVSHLIIQQPVLLNGRRRSQLINFQWLTVSLTTHPFYPESVRMFAAVFDQDNTTYPAGTAVTLTEEEIDAIIKELNTNAYEYFSPSNYLPTESTAADCSHQWKEYVGFTEVYDYCVHCDSRKDDKCYE